MTTFAITTTTNITTLLSKGGNDTYNVNGGNLTIDADTRYCPNATTATGPMGNINLSATLGGTLTISGLNCKLLQYTLGAGTVPASGTIISKGGVTAELLCVMSTRVGGTVTAAGGVMPTTGWMKVRNVTGGNFSAGLMTGITATISGPEETGWIEVVGVETMIMTINRLNALNITGDWFSVGTTSGVRGQTVQLPAFGSGVTVLGGVEIETAPGSGVYKFWANAGNLFLGSGLSTDNRCRYVGISDANLMTIGTGRDAASAGDLPPSGCNIRIPNIITSNTNLTAGYATNVVPSGTIGTRYETATSSSGVVNIDKVTGTWYWNIQQPYSVNIQNLHSCEQFVLSETSTPAILNNLHVGCSNQATPYASNAIVIQQCLNGGTATNISGLRAQQISTAGYAVYFVNLYGGWTITDVRGQFASDATALAGPVFFNTCDNITVTNVELVGKRLIMSACSNWTVTNVYYADNPKALTGSSVPTQAIELMSNCKSGTLTNIANWVGVADVHALSGLVYMNTCFDLLVTGIGSSTVPYEGGSNASFRTGYIYADGGLNKNIKFQRIWTNNLRIGLTSSTNTTQLVRMQNCYNTNATLTQGPNWYNAIVRGNRQNSGTVPTSFTHVDGMHFYDSYTSDTTTRAFLVFTEKSLTTASAYVIDSGTPKFTSTGSLVMATAGDKITYTWSYYILGWTGFTTFATTGTNVATNHLIEYDLDKGAGFSGIWKTLSNANIVAETGVSSTLGIKPKIRITCLTSNTANVLTSLVLNGTTTLAIQNTALYPLDAIGLTISGIKPGSDVIVYQAGTTNVLDTGDSVGASSYTYSYSTLQNVDIGVFLSGYVPYYIRGYLLTSTPATLPVAQLADRNYS
jgi:hypothetical protein